MSCDIVGMDLADKTGAKQSKFRHTVLLWFFLILPPLLIVMTGCQVQLADSGQSHLNLEIGEVFSDHARYTKAAVIPGSSLPGRGIIESGKAASRFERSLLKRIPPSLF
jgi:hypothetical protein